MKTYTDLRIFWIKLLETYSLLEKFEESALVRHPDIIAEIHGESPSSPLAV